MRLRGVRLPTWVAVGLSVIGAVTGAGFASGQEIWQFFSRHGPLEGTLGILGVSLAMAVMGAVALEFGRSRRVGSIELAYVFYSPRVAQALQGTMLAFFLMGLAIVVAGGGATLQGILGLPVIWGAVLTALAIAGVAAFGMNGVLAVNGFWVPFLVMCIVAVIALEGFGGRGAAPQAPAPAFGPWWLFGFLYFSYNLFIALTLLLPLGGRLGSRRESFAGAGLGALLLFGLALGIHHVLLGLPFIGDLPMVTAAGQHAGWLAKVYALGLWSALFTTGVAQLFAVVEHFGRRAIFWMVGPTLLAFIGFKSLIAGLYPIMGIIAVLYWAPLLGTWRHRGS